MLTIQLHYHQTRPWFWVTCFRSSQQVLSSCSRTTRLYLPFLNSLFCCSSMHLRPNRWLSVSKVCSCNTCPCPYRLPLSCPSRLGWPTWPTGSKAHTGWRSGDLPSLLSGDKIQVEMVCECVGGECMTGFSEGSLGDGLVDKPLASQVSVQSPELRLKSWVNVVSYTYNSRSKIGGEDR